MSPRRRSAARPARASFAPSPSTQPCARPATGLRKRRLPATTLWRCCRSEVVIEVELVRVRPESHRVELMLSLVLDPRVDHVLGEHAALEEPLVIRLEGVEDVLE